jgi:TRAP-type C4-dicarboxylate transport system permease large subunit
VTVENVPASITAFLQPFELTPLTFMLLVNLLLPVLGCILEGTTIILIVLPALIPTAEALGIGLVYFGIVTVVNIMLGLITPPYGLLLFVMQSITKLPLKDIVRETMPFLYVTIAALLFMTFFPETILLVPRAFGYEG